MKCSEKYDTINIIAFTKSIMILKFDSLIILFLEESFMRNSLRFVFNPHSSLITYYFKSEQDKWVPVSRSSPLSRSKFSNVQLDGNDDSKLESIIKTINEIYNKNNNGLDILFEGPIAYFQHLNKTIKKVLPEEDIICSLNRTDIVVIGKKGVGKTELIKSIGVLQGCNYNEEQYDNYRVFEDSVNNIRWHEIKGLVFPIKNLEDLFNTISILTKGNLTNIIYCIDATTNRMESVEEKLLVDLIKRFPKISVLIVITNSIGKSEISRSFADIVVKHVGSVNVIPVLAKDYEIETGSGEIVIKNSHGVNVLLNYIFGR